MKKQTVQRALVIGLGATGLSCVRHLAARGFDVSVVDTRTTPPKLADLRDEFPKVPLRTGPLVAPLLETPGLLVVSPGMSLQEPAIAQAIASGAEIVGDIELFAQAARAPIVAITGSNGKSTVTALTAALCRAGGFETRVGGNIGVPALSLLNASEPDVYVLELSSFQLETTSSLRAHASTVLNITPDHMDRYGDLNTYAGAKARIFDGDGLMTLNADDPMVLKMARRGRRFVRFGLEAPAGPSDYGIVSQPDSPWLAQGSSLIMPVSEVPLPGRHNLANVLAACALADSMGVNRAAQRNAVREFKGLPHRTELVADRDGVKWINDSKGTNVGATVAALKGMTAPVVLIAGGDGKGADFTELKELCVKNTRAVILIGRDAPLIAAALANSVPIHRVTDMAEAVRAAQAIAQLGDVVLLSPACASFDMYRNYEHRGDVFRAAVRELIA